MSLSLWWTCVGLKAVWPTCDVRGGVLMAPAAADVAQGIGMLQGVQEGPVLCGFSVNIRFSSSLNLVAVGKASVPKWAS